MYFCMHIIYIDTFIAFSSIFLLDYRNRLLSMPQGIYAFAENGGQRHGTPLGIWTNGNWVPIKLKHVWNTWFSCASDKLIIRTEKLSHDCKDMLTCIASPKNSTRSAKRQSTHRHRFQESRTTLWSLNVPH